jgi:hypothetical protein
MQYPLEFAKTRVQLRSQKGIPTPRNPFLVVTQVYKTEGLRALYKGCGALVVVCIHFFCSFKTTSCDGSLLTAIPSAAQDRFEIAEAVPCCHLNITIVSASKHQLANICRVLSQKMASAFFSSTKSSRLSQTQRLALFHRSGTWPLV